MNTMVIMVIVLLFFILLVFLISVIESTRTKKLHNLVDEEEKLLQSIEAKTIELTRIRQQVTNTTLNKQSNLSNVITNVLDIYESSNVRIPLDIIEELAYINLYDEKEVFDYIENQRYYWKLENTKKPYKKVK